MGDSRQGFVIGDEDIAVKSRALLAAPGAGLIVEGGTGETGSGETIVANVGCGHWEDSFFSRSCSLCKIKPYLSR